MQKPDGYTRTRIINGRLHIARADGSAPLMWDGEWVKSDARFPHLCDSIPPGGWRIAVIPPGKCPYCEYNEGC